MIMKGTFTTKMSGEPPYDEEHGITLSRATVEKVFEGDFSGHSVVEMLAARTQTPGSAGYVGLERISAKFGHQSGDRGIESGSFVVVHLGLMNRGESSLSIPIVPDSGTQGFEGIRGTMTIDVVDGVHHYVLDYEL